MRKTVFFCLTVLSACSGGNGPQSGDAANGASPNASPTASAGAQGTADAESINCNGLTPASGPDVVGVSIGMSAEDAYRAVACSNRALRVSFSERGGFPQPPSPDGRPRRSMIEASGENERIAVMLIGAPGQERVVAVRRSVDFPQGQAPVVTNLVAQLEQKYGALEHNPDQFGAWSGHALRDANNQPLLSGRNGTLLGSQCAMSLTQSNLISGCGLSVSVNISLSRENQQLASRLVVNMNNGALGMRLLDELNAQASGAAQQQQSQEVQDAQGRTPNL